MSTAKREREREARRVSIIGDGAILHSFSSKAKIDVEGRAFHRSVTFEPVAPLQQRRRKRGEAEEDCSRQDRFMRNEGSDRSARDAMVACCALTV